MGLVIFLVFFALCVFVIAYGVGGFEPDWTKEDSTRVRIVKTKSGLYDIETSFRGLSWGPCPKSPFFYEEEDAIKWAKNYKDAENSFWKSHEIKMKEGSLDKNYGSKEV